MLSCGRCDEIAAICAPPEPNEPPRLQTPRTPPPPFEPRMEAVWTRRVEPMLWQYVPATERSSGMSNLTVAVSPCVFCVVTKKLAELVPPSLVLLLVKVKFGSA